MTNPYIYAGLSPDVQRRARFGIKADIHEIIKTVCANSFIPVSEVLGKSRIRDVVEARFISMYLIRKFTTMSLKEIANVFKADHSSVIYSINKVKDRIDVEKGYKEKIDNIICEL